MVWAAKKALMTSCLMNIFEDRDDEEDFDIQMSIPKKMEDGVLALLPLLLDMLWISLLLIPFPHH